MLAAHEALTCNLERASAGARDTLAESALADFILMNDTERRCHRLKPQNAEFEFALHSMSMATKALSKFWTEVRAYTFATVNNNNNNASAASLGAPNDHRDASWFGVWRWSRVCCFPRPEMHCSHRQKYIPRAPLLPSAFRPHG